MFSELGLGPLQAPTVGSFDLLFGIFTCCLLSQKVKCYMRSGFRNSSMISIHNNISEFVVLC